MNAKKSRMKLTTVKAGPVSSKKVWFILESASLTGGVKVIYDQVSLLSRHGWDVTVVSLDQKPRWYALPPQAKWERFPHYDDIVAAMRYEGPGTLKVATWNGTAKFVRDGCEGKEGVYLVQDIEEFYFIAHSQQQAVLDTYDMGLQMYTPSLFVADWMMERGKECAYTGLWVKKQDYTYDALNRYAIFPPIVLSVLRRQSLKGFQELAEFSRRLWSLTQNARLATFSTDPGVKLAPNHTHYSGLDDKGVAQLYAQARCFTYASLREGTGMPLIEAMLSGIPVATTNATGNMSFCHDRETALVVEQGPDMAQGLTEATLRILQDADLSHYLATNARKTVETMFDYKTVSQRVLAFFDAAWEVANEGKVPALDNFAAN